MPEGTNSQDKQDKQDKKVDPMMAWQELRDIYLDAWSKAMVDTVNSEPYAQANGALLEACLTATSPFRMAMEKGMAQAAHQLKIPSREDFASLCERLTHIELRLDDLDAKLDAKLDRIEQLLSTPATAQSASANPPVRPRTRKKGATS